MRRLHTFTHSLPLIPPYTIVNAFVTTRFDYCCWLFAGLSACGPRFLDRGSAASFCAPLNRVLSVFLLPVCPLGRTELSRCWVSQLGMKSLWSLASLPGPPL